MSVKKQKDQNSTEHRHNAHDHHHNHAHSHHGHQHHGHSHLHGHSHGHPSSQGKLRLFISFLISVFILFVEIIGYKHSHSMALLGDAGHVSIDLIAHAMSLFALFLAGVKTTERFPFGLYRIEILVGLFNGLILFAVSLILLFQSFHRLYVPEEIHAIPMLQYSLVGFFANLISLLLLHKFSKSNLNLRSTYLHVLGDLFITIGVIVGSIAIQYTGEQRIDPILGILFSAIILRSTYYLLRETIFILLESYPDRDHVLRHILEIANVETCELCKIWNISTEKKAAMVSISCKRKDNAQKTVKEVRTLLESEFGIEFVSVEVVEMSTNFAITTG